MFTQHLCSTFQLKWHHNILYELKNYIWAIFNICREMHDFIMAILTTLINFKKSLLISQISLKSSFCSLWMLKIISGDKKKCILYIIYCNFLHMESLKIEFTISRVKGFMLYQTNNKRRCLHTERERWERRNW